MQKINWKIKSKSEWIHFKAYILQFLYHNRKALWKSEEKNTIQFSQFSHFFSS